MGSATSCSAMAAPAEFGGLAAVVAAGAAVFTALLRRFKRPAGAAEDGACAASGAFAPSHGAAGFSC
jgi:hypothetical protein